LTNIREKIGEDPNPKIASATMFISDVIEREE
jgi:hypothetical protein